MEIPEIKRVAILGAGSWGTVVAKMAADAGRSVVLWARRPEIAMEINEDRRNRQYLGDAELPPGVTATTDAAAAVDGADLVAIAVPSQTLRQNLSEWVDAIGPDSTLLSLMKGIELGTGKRPSTPRRCRSGTPGHVDAPHDVLDVGLLDRDVPHLRPGADLGEHGRCPDVLGIERQPLP